jgi:hypothetical protein
MHDRILAMSIGLVRTRLLMFEQLGPTIQWPVLAVLVGWICILFLGFGFFTHPNRVVIAALLLGALSVSAAMFLILELTDPYGGLLRISDGPLRNALAQLGR